MRCCGALVQFWLSKWKLRGKFLFARNLRNFARVQLAATEGLSDSHALQRAFAVLSGAGAEATFEERATAQGDASDPLGDHTRLRLVGTAAIHPTVQQCGL